MRSDNLGLGGAILHHQSHGGDVEAVDLHGALTAFPATWETSLPFNSGLLEKAIAALEAVGGSEVVELLRLVDLSVEFGDVAEIVESEWIIGIEEIGVVEGALGASRVILRQGLVRPPG